MTTKYNWPPVSMVYFWQTSRDEKSPILLWFKVICLIWKSRMTSNATFDPNRGLKIENPIWNHRWLRKDAKSVKWHRRGVNSFPRSSVNFQGYMGQNIDFCTRFECFRTVTPIFIRRYPRNDAQSFKWPILCRVYRSNFNWTWTEKSTIWLWSRYWTMTRI